MLSLDFLRFDKKTMNHFVLSLGSNIGDRNAYFREAKTRISEEIGFLTRQSSVYETAAWGNEKQDAFHNQVLEGETLLRPEELLTAILQIEAGMGRKRRVKWGPRIIDIDILFYNNEIITGDQLSIPHPMFHMRRFMMVPLAEMMPDFVDPRSGRKIRELLEELTDKLEVKKLEWIND